MPIYVETLIRASMEALWAHTQDPALHERWDLRFSHISYLPKQHEDDPQRFLYETRIGLGLAVRGEGESVGDRSKPSGERVSSLKFWSDDPKALIREGSGYWRYIPTDDGIRFLTWYDYRTRFGAAGRWFNRLVFEPLLGWATAWSFDRLRLWLERGIPPEVTRNLFFIHAIARLCLAFVFAYHGLLPKLLTRDAGEIQLFLNAGASSEGAATLCVVLGVAELLFSLWILLAWRSAAPLWIVLVGMPIATIGCLVTSPRIAFAAFNPVTLNTCVASLAAVALLSLRNIPSARNCRRQPPQVSP